MWGLRCQGCPCLAICVFHSPCFGVGSCLDCGLDLQPSRSKCWNIELLKCWNVEMLKRLTCWNIERLDCWNDSFLIKSKRNLAQQFQHFQHFNISTFVVLHISQHFNIQHWKGYTLANVDNVVNNCMSPGTCWMFKFSTYWKCPHVECWHAQMLNMLKCRMLKCWNVMVSSLGCWLAG